MIVDRMHDGGEPLDPSELLLMLDDKLGRRAADIASELEEISQVRKLIQGCLHPPENGHAKAPFGGASLGQMI